MAGARRTIRRREPQRAPDDRGRTVARCRRFPEAQAALDVLRAGGQRHIRMRLSLKTQRALADWRECCAWSFARENPALSTLQAAPLKLRAHQENLRALSSMPYAGQLLARDSGVRAPFDQSCSRCREAVDRGWRLHHAQRIIEDALDEDGTPTGGSLCAMPGRDVWAASPMAKPG